MRLTRNQILIICNVQQLLHTIKKVSNIKFFIWLMTMVRKGEIEKHSRTMTLLFYLGLVLTGAFTLLPNRIMYTVIFS